MQDMNILRRKSLCTVWLTFIPFVILAQTTANFILRFHGWPKVKTKDLSQGAIIWGLISSRVMANIPDAISICLYFSMWKHLKKVRVAPEISNPVADGFNQDEMENYGGIWVGEVSEPPTSNFDNESEVSNVNDPRKENNDDDGHHSAKAVMHALRWHLSLATLDVLFSLKRFFVCSVTKAVLVYCFQIFFIYWIPLIVIVNGFQQLKGHSKYLSVINAKPEHKIHKQNLLYIAGMVCINCIT